MQVLASFIVALLIAAATLGAEMLDGILGALGRVAREAGDHGFERSFVATVTITSGYSRTIGSDAGLTSSVISVHELLRGQAFIASTIMMMAGRLTPTLCAPAVSLTGRFLPRSNRVNQTERGVGATGRAAGCDGHLPLTH